MSSTVLKVLLCASVLLIIALANCSSNTAKSSVRLFCTYNRVFIEFEQGSATWGTMMLDNEGRPFPCGEEEIKTKLHTLRT